MSDPCIDRTVAEVGAVLERFEFRPLSTRSLLLSFMLGSHPPDLPVEVLVAFGERFGLRPGTVRTTLSRMVSRGDLTRSDAVYRLSPRLAERQRQQDAGQDPPRAPWDGTWWTTLVTAGDRTMTQRRHFRDTMVGALMGELRPDTWMRPANTAAPPTRPEVIVTNGRLVGGGDEALARSLWDVERLERDADELAVALATLDGLLDHGSEHLRLAFDVSAVCVRFLRTEPRLPPELIEMPACNDLRRSYSAFNSRFLAALSG